MKLILIEGLPGAGKSTMAETLCSAIQAQGIKANWYLEETANHPVHPSMLKADKYSDYFSSLCLKQWHNFIHSHQNTEQIIILEGSLYQNTVRFMMEAGQEQQVPDYYQQCLSVLSEVDSQLIYLRPDNARTHLSHTMQQRGELWTGKVTQYLEKSPYCEQRQWQGAHCMLSFWADYAQLCDQLFSTTTLPCIRINAGQGYFTTQYHEAFQYIYSELFGIQSPLP